MPADQRGSARRLPSGKWQLRWYEGEGEDRKRHAGGAFKSKSEALRHYRDVIEPGLDGRAVRQDLTLQELADVFLERHSKIAQPRTIRSLRERLRRPLEDFGDVPLVELEANDGRARRLCRQASRALPLLGHVRFAADVGCRSPLRLSDDKPRCVGRSEPDARAADGPDLHTGAAAVRFAAATGLRPAEWANLERRDVDRARRVIDVRGTKTRASRREVPLTSVALAALDSLPPRLDSPYVFAGPKRGPFDFHNFRRRAWGPAVEAAGVVKPARIYDLRSTFISNALASGLTIFEVARIAGTSTSMVESRYGALLDSARESLLERLEAHA